MVKLEALGCYGVKVVPLLCGLLYRPARLEDGQMLDHRRERDLERLGELADSGWPRDQVLDHASPCGIAQRPEDVFDWSSLVKHLLKYYPDAATTQAPSPIEAAALAL